ncbi:MAG: chemotaxis signal relay system methyl-accepting signal transducer [Phormidium sp. OSCR]|nr:MAG: chemotaxis signal relay system methyl-accepting signal transducer [Phormidium sp. OSCR]
MLTENTKHSEKSRGLRWKAAAIAIALGTIPVIVVGAIAYTTTNRSWREQIFTNKQGYADQVSGKLNRFMTERYGDFYAISRLPIFTNPEISLATSAQDKQDFLNTIVDAYQVYDSVALFDIQGRLMIRSSGSDTTNQLDGDNLRMILNQNVPLISSPRVASTTGKLSVYISAAILNSETGVPMGIVQARLPVSEMQNLIVSNDSDNEYVLDSQRRIFISNQGDNLNVTRFQNLPLIQQAQRLAESQVGIIRDLNQESYLLAAVPLSRNQQMVDLNWMVIVETTTENAFATSNSLLRTIAMGTLGTAIVVTILAVGVSLLITEPLIQRITEVVRTVVSASSEMAATVEQQERSLSQQAASISESTAMMEQLSRSAQRSAEQAQSAQDQAQHVLQLAKDGEVVVDRTLERTTELQQRVAGLVEQMDNLNEQTRRIGTISSLVSDLANQTNMLALNASVEAVRAGDAGRGFAVVASEIRKLADQSRHSAEKIDTLVEMIQSAINTTSSLAQESTSAVGDTTGFAHQTAEKFMGVKNAIQKIAVGSQQIAANAQQQARAIEQLTEAMTALDSGANETASSISQTRAGSQHLNDAAVSLQKMV